MKQSQCEIDGESSLRILVGISSRSQALLGLSSESCLTAPWELTIKSEMEVYGDWPLFGIGVFSRVNTYILNGTGS
jgi:hypothetical protein